MDISFPNFNIESLLLIAAGVLNLFFGVLIYSKDKKKISSVYFSLIAMGVSIWAFSRAFFEISGTTFQNYLWGVIMYVSAALIPIAFLFFSDSFGNESLSFRKRTSTLIVLSYIAVIGVTLFPDFLIRDITMTAQGKFIYFGDGLLYYSIFIVGYFSASFVKLFRKLMGSTGIFRTQIIYIFAGTSIASIIGVTTNLFLPAIGQFQLFWVGPVATVIMVGFIAYAILKHHLFNIRVIMAEVFTFVLWISIGIRILLSETLRERIFDSMLLFISVLFGVLLVKSVIKEMNTNEEIGALVTRLQVANEHLRELDRQKTEFVSIASHQLRTPLTAIKGYASMILDGSFGEIPQETREPVERIFRSSIRLADTVEDFLNVTRIEQGRMQYDMEPVDMYTLTKEVVDELGFAAKEKNIALEVSCDDKDHTISGDRGKLRQVILNLVDNAIKYTPQGSVTTKVSGRKQGRHMMVVVEITDTGIGIPFDFMDDLFGKFNRGENSGMYHTNGSGIGLYVANEIIKAHHGVIEVHTNEGTGTTFAVILPGQSHSLKREKIRKASTA